MHYFYYACMRCEIIPTILRLNGFGGAIHFRLLRFIPNIYIFSYIFLTIFDNLLSSSFHLDFRVFDFYF